MVRTGATGSESPSSRDTNRLGNVCMFGHLYSCTHIPTRDKGPVPHCAPTKATYPVTVTRTKANWRIAGRAVSGSETV